MLFSFHGLQKLPSRLADEVAKLRENASAMLEASRLEEASLRRLLETAAAEGRRLVKELERAEAARDEALAVGRGVGGEAEGLRERLRKVLDEKTAFEKGAAAELTSKVRGCGDVRVTNALLVLDTSTSAAVGVRLSPRRLSARRACLGSPQNLLWRIAAIICTRCQLEPKDSPHNSPEAG